MKKFCYSAQKTKKLSRLKQLYKNIKNQNTSHVKLHRYFSCQGLVSKERLHEFENLVKNLEVDIIGLAEARKKGENLMKKENGNLYYYFGTIIGKMLGST